MPKIIAYSWQADTHSIEDTKAAAASRALQVNNYHPHAHGLSSSPAGNRDEHGLHVNLCDPEGNMIHPVFDTDEQGLTKADKHCEAYKATYHERNDAKALALQMKDHNNGGLV